MTVERWQELDELFAEARQRPAESRAEFVGRACGDDQGLRADLMSLLTAADESDEFMAAPALQRLASEIGRHGWGLRSGERLGAYTVEGRLGVGGGGEVWRARDDRLGRDVAIKVLLPQFSSDAQRVRAFLDEARTAGGLNHPNVVSVYDVGDHHGAPFLVSECLEGESLRQRLAAGGPLGVDRATAIALQLARGLAAVHARGIIHRDLKPENVFLRSDGGVKIIDFGLAKLQPDLPNCPETSALPGIAPIVAGTAGYMSPEQVRGEPIDARTDLFALGATMYEMLAGCRPFEGTNTRETLRAIVSTEPPDLLDSDRPIPAELAAIVKRLLEKAPAARFQSAADLAWALEQLASVIRIRAKRAPVALRGFLQEPFRWSLVAVALGLLAIPLWMRSRPSRLDMGRLAQFTWSLPADLTLWSEAVVSPDSSRIAFVGADDTGHRIFIRHLDSLDATAIAGTEGAKQPFWSPDGTSLGFFANGKLMKVSVDGGTSTVICDAPDGRGGAWSRSRVIVFQPDFRDTGLMRVRDSGGPVEAATLLDVTGSDVGHRWPVMLPDGEHFLFLVASADDQRRGVYVASLGVTATRPSTRLFPSSSGAVYVPSNRESGILLSAADRSIEARPFNAARRQVTGDARRIELPAAGSTPHHPALLSASPDLLAFGATPVPWGAHMAVIARDGTGLSLWPERELGGFHRVSPDGGRLARTRVDAVTADIWVDDLVRNTRLRVTTSRDLDVFSVWSPDGQQIAYRSGTKVHPTLNITAADGTGVSSVLQCPRAYCEPTDWTADGLLVVNVSGGDVWAIPATASASARPILSDSFLERDARVSPDGRWIAYVSEESGRPEVSVRSLEGVSRRFVVSTLGGDQPVWRRDGAELFYVTADGLLHGVAVRALENGSLSFGLPQQLAVPRFAPRHWGTAYDVSPDGKRVFFHHPGNAGAPREVGIVLGWRALLDQAGPGLLTPRRQSSGPE